MTEDSADAAFATERRQRIAATSDRFPPLLKQIADAPNDLNIVGDPDLLHLPAIAIVGSRNPTRGGAETAYRFSRHLSEAGFCIVSGLAQGIDTAAHEGALDATSKTVAVLGHGLDQVYPKSNAALAKTHRSYRHVGVGIPRRHTAAARVFPAAQPDH